MIIKKLKIKRFGALKDKDLEFKEGLNIVTGENEAGKSTLQNFIRAFLYGMDNKKKSIRDSIRTRYGSFNGENASGEMEIENKGDDILIIRSFGATKKSDKLDVVNSLTGNIEKELNHDEIGKTIFNINSDTFDNTLFIKGLGTSLSSSKDDEIMHKLTNSFESGEEGVSYFKALGKLDSIKKALTTARGNGKLDNLKEKRMELIDEREKFLRYSNENLENEVQIVKLKENISQLELTLKKLEIFKKHLRKIKLQKEYKDILGYVKKSEELKNKAQELQGELQGEEGIVSREKIEELKEECAVLLDNYKLIEEKGNEKNIIKQEKLETEEGVNEFKSLIDLGEDLEERVHKILLEKDKYRAKSMIYEENKKELMELEGRLDTIKNSLGKYIVVEEYEEEISSILKEYEDKLIQLKNKTSDIKSLDYSKELEKCKGKKKIYTVLIAIGVLASIGLIFVNPMFSIVPLLISGVFLSLSFTNSKNIDEFIKKEEEQKEFQQLENSIRETEEKLGKMGDELGIHSYEELGKALFEYRKHKDEIKTLERMAEEKENKLNSHKIEEVSTVKVENENIINKMLLHTNSANIEELLEKIKKLKSLEGRLEIVNHKCNNFMESYEAMKTDIDNKETSLNKKLKSIRLDNISIYDLPKELEKLTEKLNEKDEVLSALNGVSETYRALLKDRDLEHIKEDLKEMLSEDLDYSYESEEAVEEEIKNSNNKLLENEKLLKDVENIVLNKFNGIRSLIAIEADFQEVSDKIDIYQKELEALELAKELLEESFKELQKNIGPILNERVSFYFNKLTTGRYTEVKVGDKYELLVRQDNGDILRGEYLSNGTWDQVYLSLRLALVDMLFGDEKVPLIFDDAFIQYDDKRLENILDVIKDLSEKRQVILFSCQNREKNLLNNCANVINL